MPRSRNNDSRYTDLFSHPAFVRSLVEQDDPAMLEENLRIYFAQARAEGRDEA